MQNTATLKRCVLVVMLVFLSVTACENPFDPIDKSEEIRGLSYIDFSLVWDRWDSDPGPDGVIVTLEYFNEFNDSLSFHDKAHRVIVEFWSQETAGGVAVEDNEGNVTLEGGRPVNGNLLFSWPVEISFSDDEIRVPRESYEPALNAAGLIQESSIVDENGKVVDPEPVELFVIVRVFPPKAIPQAELIAFYGDQVVWEPPEAVINPEANSDGS